MANQMILKLETELSCWSTNYISGREERRHRKKFQYLALDSTSHNLMRTLGWKMKAAQATEWSKPVPQSKD